MPLTIAFRDLGRQTNLPRACLLDLEENISIVSFFVIYNDIEYITTEDEEYDQHSIHMYSKHRRRRRNTTDFVGQFVEGQISRSESFPG